MMFQCARIRTRACVFMCLRAVVQFLRLRYMLVRLGYGHDYTRTQRAHVRIHSKETCVKKTEEADDDESYKEHVCHWKFPLHTDFVFSFVISCIQFVDEIGWVFSFARDTKEKVFTVQIENLSTNKIEVFFSSGKGNKDRIFTQFIMCFWKLGRAFVYVPARDSRVKITNLE